MTLEQIAPGHFREMNYEGSARRLLKLVPYDQLVNALLPGKHAGELEKRMVEDEIADRKKRGIADHVEGERK